MALLDLNAIMAGDIGNSGMSFEDYLSPFTTRSLLPARQCNDTWCRISPQAQERLALRKSLEEPNLDKLVNRFSDITVERAPQRKPYVVQKLKKSTFRWYAEKKRRSDEGYIEKLATPQPESVPKRDRNHPIHHSVRLPPLPPLPKPKPRPQPLSLPYDPPLTPRAWTPLPL